jgi:hypothetical protein
MSAARAKQGDQGPPCLLVLTNSLADDSPCHTVRLTQSPLWPWYPVPYSVASTRHTAWRTPTKCRPSLPQQSLPASKWQRAPLENVCGTDRTVPPSRITLDCSRRHRMRSSPRADPTLIVLWYHVVCEGRSGAVLTPLFALAPRVALPQDHITTASRQRSPACVDLWEQGLSS